MFNNIGLPGLLLIAVVLLVLFGKGKVQPDGRSRQGHHRLQEGREATAPRKSRRPRPPRPRT
jgi:Sec-independent protein translocase protein TatA